MIAADPGRAVIVGQLQRSHARLLKVVEDLSAEDLAAIPHLELAPMIWQVGHITVSDAHYARYCGRTVDIPDAFEPLFRMGSGGVADYPALGEVQPVFDRVQSVLARIAESEDLTRPVEHRSLPSVGDILVFAIFHRGYHIGKISTLRAMLGKPLPFPRPPRRAS